MGRLLGIVLSWFTTQLITAVIKYIFSGALGIASYGIVTAIFNRYINQALAELTDIEALSYIINLSRLDDALSVVIGALTIRASMLAMTIKLISTDKV